MLKRIVASVILTVFITSAIAQQQTCAPVTHSAINITSGMAYHEAREKLIQAGWQPLQTVRWQELDDTLFGQARMFWEKGYQEIEDCAGSGLVPCMFNFKDVYNNHLMVGTVGEEDPEYDAFATVTGFRFECH